MGRFVLLPLLVYDTKAYKLEKFMLLSLGILVRTKILQKLGYKEELRNRNVELQAKIEDIERSQSSEEKRKSKQMVGV